VQSLKAVCVCTRAQLRGNTALDGKPCTIETNSAQKRQSHCVVYENRNQIIFSLLLEKKNTLKQEWIGCFFTLKVYCAYSNNGKNVKITETVAIGVTKHPAKF